MLESEFRIVLEKAVQEEKVSLTFPSSRMAYNIRQRLYRFRDKLRESDSDSLALLIDQFRFEIDGTKLIVHFEKPLSLLEKIDE